MTSSTSGTAHTATRLLPGSTLSGSGRFWLRGWKAYRADSTPEGTVPKLLVLVTHWEPV